MIPDLCVGFCLVSSRQFMLLTSDKKSLRQSTKSKSQAAVEREKEREVRVRVLKEVAAKKNVAEVRRLTQEELLEEAKITEKINFKSLGKLQWHPQMHF